ncbi:MAG TPA: tRNA preQ1(34) S-adenosylmethionine ribosyltransferase-isomerase QueA [Phycisphaerae bacterium]|nr:tRNA preQ1(34) S-adenosylmethionine ribosyltransferase-isomerase QueA [Phycisphaerae bacterium]
MRLNQLQYELPLQLIAQEPALRRDAGRLLVLDRHSGQTRHRSMNDLPDVLPRGCTLVMNDTRVLPARLSLRRRSGGKVDGLYLQENLPGMWEVMLTGAARVKPGEELLVEGSKRKLRLHKRVEAGVWRAEPVPGGEAATILAEIGRPPLPPYIERKGIVPPEQTARDVERYQTIYAANPGAVAAPTAGLHFTPELFRRLDEAGIARAMVTLHVGVGTFAPIRCEDLADHPMHAEWYSCPAATADVVNAARTQGRPVVAVGTTSVRVLETCADGAGRVQAGEGWTRLFIYPPYRFKAVDAMITNFHLPGSTLLAMIFAFAGRENVLAAYNEAIERRYRFYSYGDAMLIRDGLPE